MASINQIVSEIVHSVGQPNNIALKENVKLLIYQTRNELIRKSYENHGYIDKVLTQRFKIELIDLLDGDIQLTYTNNPNNSQEIYDRVIDNPFKFEEYNPDLSEFLARGIKYIKRSKQRIPRPIRLTNNLPFDRVSSVGYHSNKEIPFIKETSARFRSSVPGLTGLPSYDYINGYIYIFPSDNKPFKLNKIVIESVFEKPKQIEINTDTYDEEYEKERLDMDDDEWLFSEDMIGQIKDIIIKRDLLANVVRETNEIPNTIKAK